jgi:PST family polysaccharide transporter
VVRHLSGFRWSTENEYTGLFFTALITTIFGGFYILPLAWASGVGIVAAIISGIYSVRVLLHLVSVSRIPESVRRFLVLFRLAPSAS